jgi:hypothetical protein
MNDLQEKFLDTRFEMLASERVRLPSVRKVRVRYKNRSETIEGIEERLSDIETWSRASKRALRLLHLRARAEQGERRNCKNGQIGPYEALENELFGNPLDLMSKNDDYGLGFNASLVDGPAIGIFDLCGIYPDSNLHDRFVSKYSWLRLFEESQNANCEVLTHSDCGPGTCDTYYWVCVSDPTGLAREIRERIVDLA